MDKFFEGVAGKLADRFAALAGPTLAFWVGGALAWVHGHGGLTGIPDEVSRAVNRLSRHSAAAQVLVVAVVVIGLVASGLVVRHFSFPVLRLLEGHWPEPAGRLRKWLVARHRRKIDAYRARLQELAARVIDDEGVATTAELAEFQRLDRRLRRYPAVHERVMPTRLGNTLRAGESRPVDKYGLDVVAIWSHLWLVLPEHARAELTAARGRLDAAVGGFLWSVAFFAFTAWTPWAALVAAIALVWCHRRLLQERGETFADLVEATADLYRFQLYEHLRWPLPTSPAQERQVGRNVTTFLVRGSDRNVPLYVVRESDQPPVWVNPAQ
ncbi:hypothetical protein ACFVP3_39595 [Streptomyces sp. NPDC057806]|uniref:hypothetical protein n=1 Tax=Streptomyces sp. NPDC057806 TaxID=3346255 RepID=UPI0036C24481